MRIKFNRTNYIFLLIAGSFFYLTACKKQVNFIKNNTTKVDSGYYPVSTNPLIDINDSNALDNHKYAPDATATFELQFFSQSPIKEVDLYSIVPGGDMTLVSSWPYQPQHSTFLDLDTLLLSYKVPQTATSGDTIKLLTKILNENALYLLRRDSIIVQ